jgi:hypothetical protein
MMAAAEETQPRAEVIDLCHEANAHLGYRGVDPEFDTDKRAYTGRLVISKRALSELLNNDQGRLLACRA